MEKPRFASFVDVFLDIQVNVLKFLARVTGATPVFPKVRKSKFTLESCCFVPINMNSVLSSLSLSLSVSIQVHVRYTAFHDNDHISLISSRVWTKRQVKLSVISIGMRFRLTGFDDFKQFPGINGEQQ